MVRMTMGLLLLGLALVGCGLNLCLRQPCQYYRVQTTEPYKVKPGGTTESPSLRVYVEPGAPGGRLEGYELMYVNNGNKEVIQGDPGGGGKINIRIPPGSKCSVNEDPCPPDKRVFSGNLSDEFKVPVLDGQIAEKLLEAVRQGSGTLNWRMKIRWKAVDDNWKEHFWEEEYKIQFVNE